MKNQFKSQFISENKLVGLIKKPFSVAYYYLLSDCCEEESYTIQKLW